MSKLSQRSFLEERLSAIFDEPQGHDFKLQLQK